MSHWWKAPKRIKTVRYASALLDLDRYNPPAQRIAALSLPSISPFHAFSIADRGAETSLLDSKAVDSEVASGTLACSMHATSLVGIAIGRGILLRVRFPGACCVLVLLCATMMINVVEPRSFFVLDLCVPFSFSSVFSTPFLLSFLSIAS